uniref:Uncharacterized protein n=1 Tax=Anser brachyrhynchus TaxID=132585 RepID=A0A8B9BZC8_9AVES
MEDTSVSGLDNSKLEAIAHEIYTELVEGACLGLCFKVHHGAKCSNFYLDDKTHGAVKHPNIQPDVCVFGYSLWGTGNEERSSHTVHQPEDKTQELRGSTS